MSNNFYDWPADEFEAFANSLIIDGMQASFPYCWQIQAQKDIDATIETEEKSGPNSRDRILKCLDTHTQLSIADLARKMNSGHQTTLNHCRILHRYKAVRLNEDQVMTVSIVPGWKKKIQDIEAKTRSGRIARAKTRSGRIARAK